MGPKAAESSSGKFTDNYMYMNFFSNRRLMEGPRYLLHLLKKVSSKKYQAVHEAAALGVPHENGGVALSFDSISTTEQVDPAKATTTENGNMK